MERGGPSSLAGGSRRARPSGGTRFGTSLTPVSDRFIDLGSAIPLSGNPNVVAIGQRYISDRMMHLNVD